MTDFSGWESPVNVIQSQMSMEIEGEIMRAVQKVGVIVDKEELINALRYDRGQYDKGFMNGYNKAIDDFAGRLIRYVDCGHLCSPTEMRWSDLSVVEMVKKLAEQLKVGGRE